MKNTLSARCCAGLHNTESCSRDMQSRRIEVLQGNEHRKKEDAGPSGPKANEKGLSSSDQGRLHTGLIAELALRRGLETWQTDKMR